MFGAFETRRRSHAFYFVLHNHSSCFAYLFFQHGDVASFKNPSIVLKQIPSPKTNIAPARRPSLKRKLFHLPTNRQVIFWCYVCVFREGNAPTIIGLEGSNLQLDENSGALVFWKKSWCVLLGFFLPSVLVA